MDVSRQITETLKQISRCFAKAGIQFCLIGGLAVSILAKPRATEDIDLLVLTDENDVPRLIDVLRTCMTIMNIPAIMHFGNATIQRVVVQAPCASDEGLVIVDLVVADKDVYRNALKDPFTITVDEVTIPVASRKSLIEIKRLSNRPQDLIDIESLEETEDI